MNRIRLTLVGSVIVLACVSAFAQGDPFRAFGLTNTPIGDTYITFQGGTMRVSPGPVDLAATGAVLTDGDYGVSIQLGEADAGIWAYPYHDGYFGDGNFMVARVFGDVNGGADQPVCTMSAQRQGEGNHVIQMDFSPIGASPLIYQVYANDVLVASATNTSGEAHIHTYSQSGPRANPFWRLSDGSIAGVVELSEQTWITLPGAEDSGGYGDRLIIRGVNPTSPVNFVSRVDVMGGGGLDHFLITGLRLGIFSHAHLAVGPALLNAAGGRLEVTDPDSSGQEYGVAIELDRMSRFDINLTPLELATNASIVASAVGTVNHVPGDFVGYAGVRNSNGVLQAFASLLAIEPEMQIAVYRDSCLVGTAIASSSLGVVTLSRRPRVIGFGARDSGLANQHPPGLQAGLSISFDAVTTFRLPSGATLDGNEVRFRSQNPAAIEDITAFNLVASHLGAFSIAGETTAETISLADYVVDLQPGASIKRFRDAQGSNFVRTVSVTNAPNAFGLIRVADSYSPSNVVAELFSFGGGDYLYHGQNSALGDSFSATGIRVLPEEFRLGLTYTATADFVVRDPNFNHYLKQTTTKWTRAAGFETLTIPAGTFTALRLDSAEISTRYDTNGQIWQVVSPRTDWLVAGVGVVKFAVSMGESERRGELVDYNLITSQPRDQTINVGGNVVFNVQVSVPANVSAESLYFEWRRNGVIVSNSLSALFLGNVQLTDSGNYSVMVSNSAGITTAALGSLRVVPFSDPACFRAHRIGGTAGGSGQSVSAAAVLVDRSNNFYLVGQFERMVVFDGITLTNNGGSDVFIAKMSPSGQYLWAVRGGGDGSSEYAIGAALDDAGNIYIAGSLDGASVFGTNQLSSNGTRDLFVAKADQNGNFLWAVRAGGNEYDFPSDMTVDRLGNVYVTGPFYNSITLGNIVLTSGNYGNNCFITKLDTSGQFLWARAVNSAYPTALATGPADEIYITGGINAAATFDGTILGPQAGGLAGFLARIDADGNFVWAKKLADGDAGHDVAVDTAGNVYVAGGLAGLATLGNVLVSSRSTSRYYPERFVAKLDNTGQFLWARKAAGTPYYSDYSRLAVDGAGNAYLFNSFYSIADVGTASLFSGETRLLVSKVDSSGQGVWVKQIGGDYQRCIAADSVGNVYLAASFFQSARFGDFVLTSTPSSYNVYVAKMCVPPPPVIATQPQSLTVDPGTNATFSVSATNTAPLSYQWRKDGAKIPGATNSTLTISNVQSSDAGAYSVVVSGDGGSVNSRQATLTVTGPYAGTIGFAVVNYNVSEGSGVATLEVLRTGSSTGIVTIEFGTGNGSALANVDYLPTAGILRFGDGEYVKTIDVPILDNRIFEDDKTLVVRLCGPKGGATLGTNDVATVTIDNDDSPAPLIISQPRTRALVVGNRAIFSVTVSGLAPFHYQWRKNGTPIPGANGSSYILPSAQPADAGTYAVVITNDFGETFSDNAALTVFPLPSIVEQPHSQSVERGGVATLRVTATGSGSVTQNFHRVATSGYEDRLSLANVGSSGRFTINYDFFGLPDSLRIYYEYNVLVDTGVTNGAGSASATYARTYYGGTLDVVMNEGGSGHPTTAWMYDLQVIADGLRYQWRRNGMIIGGATGPVLYIPFVGPDTAGEYTVTVRDNHGSVVSQTAVLIVVPPAPPLLRITRVNATDLMLSWDKPNFFLERADTANGEWSTFQTYGNSIVITPGSDVSFFRLRENYEFGSD